jgi:hypothetical protein
MEREKMKTSQVKFKLCFLIHWVIQIDKGNKNKQNNKLKRDVQLTAWMKNVQTDKKNEWTAISSITQEDY